jgi:iron complex outermembrane receptor protein
VAAVCRQEQDTKFDYPAWTAGLDWEASDDLFLYIKTSGAAKAGGWNLRAGSLPAFDPEKVKDVEAGLKADLLDGHLRTNVALFHTWKSGVQAVVNAFVPGVGVTQYIQNNGDARIWGAEFEVTALPWEGMEITANLSLQDGKYKAGSFAETQRIASVAPLAGCAAAPPTAGGVPQFDCVADLSGETLPQLPKTQFNFGATQSVPVGSGDLSFHADYAYVSGQRFNSAVAAPQQSAAVQTQYAIEESLNKIKGYGLFNGRIAYKLDDPGLEVYVFARNIFKNKYVVRSFADLYRQIGFAVEYPGADRMFGIGASWKFDK